MTFRVPSVSLLVAIAAVLMLLIILVGEIYAGNALEATTLSAQKAQSVCQAPQEPAALRLLRRYIRLP